MFVPSWLYEVSLLNSSNSLTISSNAFIIKKIIICSRLYLCRLSFHRIFSLLSTPSFYISTIGFTILFLVPKTMLVVHSCILIVVIVIIIVVMIFDIYQRFFDFVYSIIRYERLKFYVRFVLFIIKFVLSQDGFCSEEVV